MLILFGWFKISVGELSDSDDDSDASFKFDDGYDHDLLGDEEDRARLQQMSEKDREQEIFKRLERREMLRERLV